MFKRSFSLLVSTALVALPLPALANPAGATVVSGDISFSTPDASTLVIQQNTQQGVINFQDFNVNAGETTRFVQPNAAAVTLNRVTGGNESQILGNLEANGQIFLINPNGVVFGQGSRVDVGGLVATTSNLSDENFAAGTYQFTATDGSGSILNAGDITAAEGGLVALVAPTVQNNGVITARLGKVSLAGGDTFTVDLNGDQLVTLAVKEGTLANSLAANSGAIHAAGGLVNISAGQAADALNNVVNLGGIVAANSLDTANGKIILSSLGGNTAVSGALSAAGGTVQVLGDTVTLTETASIDVSAQNGGANQNGGHIFVGGNFRGEGPLPNAQNTTIAAGATLNADALQTGNGGDVVVWADNHTFFGGDISSRGGSQSGNGGDVEVSGKQTLAFRGTVNTTAANGELGTLLLDPQDIVITDGVAEGDDGEVGDGLVAGADGGGADFTISANALEALAAGTNVTLEATRNITLNNLADDELNLATTGQVIFRANSNFDGTGDFTADASDTIRTGGASVNIEGINVALGGVDTSDGVGGGITITASNLTLNDNLNTDGGNLIINAATTLNNNVAFSSGAGSGNVLLSGALGGDFNFDIGAGNAGNIQLQDVDINRISFTTGQNLSLNGDVSTDLGQDFSQLEAINLLTNVTLTSDDGGARNNIVFGNDNELNGAFDLSLIGAIVTLDVAGNVIPLNSLTVDAGTTAVIESSIITSGQVQITGDSEITGNITTNNSDVRLLGDTLLTSAVGINTGTGGGDILLNGNVDGGFNFLLGAGTGDVNFSGTVGANTALADLNVTANAITVLAGASTNGAQSYSGALTLAGDFITTDDDINLNSPVILTGNTSFDTGAAEGDININSTIDGPFDLDIASGTGTAIFGGDVGSITPLDDINVSGQVVAVNTTTSTGSQNFVGELSLNGDLNVGSGPIELLGNVTVLGDSRLTSGGGATEGININGSLTGDSNVELIAGLGDVVLRNVDVDTLTLTSGDDVELNGTITTDTALDFSNLDAVTIGSDTVITAIDGTVVQNVIFDADNIITSSGSNLTVTGDTVQIQNIAGTNNVVLDGATAVNVVNGINTDGTITVVGASNIGGDFITTDDTVQFTGAVTLNNPVTVNTGAGAGSIAFSSTIDGTQDLDLLAGTGDITILADIGAATPLNTLDVIGQNIRVQNVTTLGGQNFTGDIQESGLLTGGQAINLTGDVVLGGGVTTSVGDVNIIGDVLLTADSILESGGTAADAISIQGDIAGDFDLDFQAGLANINLLGNLDINQWLLTSGNDLTLGGGTFQTDLAQDFTNINNIILSADTTFSAQDTGVSPPVVADILFGANNTITGAFNLAFLGDTITLQNIGDPAVPATTPLSLNVDAQTFNLLGTVSTVGEQTFTSLEGLANNLITQGSNITLNTNIDLLGDVSISTGPGGGNIIFGGPVEGAQNLIVDAGTGLIQADFDFGGDTPLQSLALTAASLNLQNIITFGEQSFTGVTTLNGNFLSSSGGNLTFNDAITLANDIVFDTNATLGGDITFNDTVNGPFDLNFNAGTGAITFAELAGGVTRLDTLTLDSAGDINLQEGIFLTTIESSNISGAVDLGSGVGLNALSDITFRRPSSLVGNLTGEDIILDSSGSINVDVVADTLAIGGSSSIISAIVGGEDGRTAVLRTQFLTLSGGPHFINGFNAPLTGIIQAPQTLNLTAFTRKQNPLAVVQNTSARAQASLSPFNAQADLLVENQTDINLNFNPNLAELDDDEENLFLLN